MRWNDDCKMCMNVWVVFGCLEYDAGADDHRMRFQYMVSIFLDQNLCISMMILLIGTYDPNLIIYRQFIVTWDSFQKLKSKCGFTFVIKMFLCSQVYQWVFVQQIKGELQIFIVFMIFFLFIDDDTFDRDIWFTSDYLSTIYCYLRFSSYVLTVLQYIGIH